MLFASVLFVILVPIWLFFIAPKILSLSVNFHYGADIHSVDNFYNEERGDFAGEVNSSTKFYYDFVSEEKNGVYLIKNVFDVRTPEGEPIFAVERLYGVDPTTGKHVAGYGDKDREGYLFAPRWLSKDRDFLYWHINYDAPATLKFEEQVYLEGLMVYRYAVDYVVDQTENLGHLPGVPDKRGVNLDVNLQVWVEPTSGSLVKYQDSTIAYYYDQITKQRQNPWNKFSNSFTDESISSHIAEARSQKYKIIAVSTVIPVGLGIIAALSLLIGYFRSRTVVV